MVKLLIVDDETVTRNTLEQKINWNDLGVTEVITAKNGLEALNVCEKFTPDICLSDIKMPKMNGIQLGYCLKDKFPSCRLIYLSGYCDKEYLKSAIDLQVAGYIEKPIQLSSIRDIINRIAGTIMIEKTAALRPEGNGITFNQFYNEPAENCSYFNLPVDFIYHFRSHLLNHSSQAMEDLCSLTTSIRKCKDKRINYIISVYYHCLSVILQTAENSHLHSPFTKEDEEKIWQEMDSLTTLNQFHDFILSQIALLPDIIHTVSPKTAAIIDYIRENYSSPVLSVTLISEQMYITKTYLCSLFKKETGKTINEYITEVRIEKAKELLSQRDCRLYEISTQVGITDPNYFSTLFRKHTQLSPSEYREKYYQ